MTVDEIFSELSAHYVGALMFHDQLANYYDFLQLRGYKRCHEYHFKAESCAYRKLNRYFINHYGKLIPEKRVDDPHVIPESWYKYSRDEVDVSTKKSAIKMGMMRWVNWERNTKEALEDYYCDLVELNEISAATFIQEFIKDVDCELKYAERKHIELESVDYDMTYISGEQTYLHDKYKKKMKYT